MIYTTADCYHSFLKKMEKVLSKFIRIPIKNKIYSSTQLPHPDCSIHESNKYHIVPSEYVFNVSNDDLTTIKPTSNTQTNIDFSIYMKCFVH